MTPFVLAIDIGTTSTKVLAVIATGEVLKSHQEFYPTQYPSPGHVEQDVQQIFAAVHGGINEVLNCVSSDLNLVGVCFSCAMHSLLAVDHRGSPLTPVIIWADTRSSKQAKKLRGTELGKYLHDRTGTAIHPMSPLCKLLWWQEHHPELIQQAYKFISIKEYIVFHLCGEFVVDYSIASATGIFDIQALSWSHEALELIDLSTDKLSRPVGADFSFTINTDKGFNSRLINVPIFMGASDGCLAQLGCGAMNEGDLTITIGTSGAARRVGAKGLKDPDRKLFRYMLDESTMIVGGATNNGTVILDWFGREFLSPTSTLADLVKVADEIPAGSEGLVALPFLLGERAPIYNPDAKGVFFNITLRHTKAHFIKALMEGICFELLSIVTSLEEVCGSSKQVLVSGGFIHAPEWVQLLSTILDKELIVSGTHDTSALGAAAIAFKALQIPFQIDGSHSIRFVPDRSKNELYRQHFIQFESLYRKVENHFF
ncbi:MAG: gluconokinase [Cyclobacteriaceae bacterium]|nr:gluconokinase [Cyclobacteriaceae bacterium]